MVPNPVHRVPPKGAQGAFLALDPVHRVPAKNGAQGAPFNPVHRVPLWVRNPVHRVPPTLATRVHRVPIGCTGCPQKIGCTGCFLAGAYNVGGTLFTRLQTRIGTLCTIFLGAPCAPDFQGHPVHPYFGGTLCTRFRAQKAPCAPFGGTLCTRFGTTMSPCAPNPVWQYW